MPWSAGCDERGRRRRGSAPPAPRSRETPGRCPPQIKGGSWDDTRDEVGEQIIDVLTEYAPNFRESLIGWTVQAPVDIESRTGITDGNIRHGDMIPQQMLSLRFPYRTPIRNFYLCGAGTHPGGEVTGAPGHNAAQAILKDLDRVVE